MTKKFTVTEGTVKFKGKKYEAGETIEASGEADEKALAHCKVKAEAKKESAEEKAKRLADEKSDAEAAAKAAAAAPGASK